MIIGRHGLSLRRPYAPGTTYDRAETVQTTGATSASPLMLEVDPQ